jgi:hypothetical protein
VKLRVLFVGGAIAALSAIPLTAQAGLGTPSCGAAFSPAGNVVTNPATGGTYYVNQSGGATGGAAGAGVGGSPGFIEANATGTAGPPPSGSLTVEGNQTQSGLNGKVVVSSSPSVCVGSTVAGQGVTVP